MAFVGHLWVGGEKIKPVSVRGAYDAAAVVETQIFTPESVNFGPEWVRLRARDGAADVVFPSITTGHSRQTPTTRVVGKWKLCQCPSGGGAEIAAVGAA